MNEYVFRVPPGMAQIIFAGLAELPLKTSSATYNELMRQAAEQESAAKQPLTGKPEQAAQAQGEAS